MYSAFASAVLLAPFLACVAATLSPTPPAAASSGRYRAEIQTHNDETASTKFLLPCEGCLSGGGYESFVFDLQLLPPKVDQEKQYPCIRLNGFDYDLSPADTRFTTFTQDEANGTHAVALFIKGVSALTGTDNLRSVMINVEAVDGRYCDGERESQAGFTLLSEFASAPRLRTLTLLPQGDMVDFASLVPPFADVVDHEADDTTEPESDWDLEAELGELQLLMVQAEELHTRIAEKNEIIHLYVKQHEVSLKDAIKQCDGLICAAKVIAQRLCQRVQHASSSHAYFKLADANRAQRMMAYKDDSDSEPQQAARNCTKSKGVLRGRIGATDLPPCIAEKNSAHMEASSLPLMLTKNTTTTSPVLVDLVITKNPLAQAFEIIAAVVGLAALISFIKRKCMSMRKRVERAADREERRNARAYRRAARRALWRRRYDDFISAVSCFRQPASGTDDYEEKRALILQDAFLEQSQDQAEKGEIMEAEIRELRHAHEIVSSLVRVDEHRYVPVRDLPPPLVPLPYTPASRSRASTGSLPSYNSESLPDYTSTPESTEDSGSVLDGFRHYSPVSSDEERNYTPDETSEASSSAGTRYTPTSSIREISPRCSAETLRTRLSKDTQDL